MEAGLSTSVLADMSEKQQVEVAFQLSETTVRSASMLQQAATWATEWRRGRCWRRARQAAVLESILAARARRREKGVGVDGEVVVDEVATASAARKRKIGILPVVR